MVQRIVGKIEAPGGKVAVVGGDVHGDIVLDGGPAPLFACCPPALPYSLVGRDDALAELRAKLCGGKAAALTALTGLPGVGKTALATALVYDPAICAHFRGVSSGRASGPRLTWRARSTAGPRRSGSSSAPPPSRARGRRMPAGQQWVTPASGTR
jgi:hypothetical protein